ncbi:triose-phosphate isomerase [Phenylobacterium deserti]|uniref:Triosephosphate isomerase n=1 Tax=Phenylobacterium deserti TaxID=1914756 RepID=A0A328AE62_9CAUL|nr:triose-phosphate isomerase [Phenylobacterium deserti]RAK52960.1 triose-phosphate isomerase [Phenylobacterium deserti]
MREPVPLIAGNWKMNGLASSAAEAKAIAEGIGGTRARVAVCPPAILTHRISEALADSPVIVGGQDAHWDDAGAFTGDISAEMLADAGAKLVILGHSERRQGYRETDEVVRRKVLAALRAGLEPLVCVGETLEEHDAGQAHAVVTRQVRGSLPPELKGTPFAIGYEPVWAIGTGRTPTCGQIEQIHRAIRDTLVDIFGEDGASVPILYGGSVKPSNAAEILHTAEVGGALVGGASLKADEFLEIVRAL